MKKIGQLLLKAAESLFNFLFEWLCSLSEEDDYDDSWPVETYPVAKCHICGHEAPGHHHKGEFIVCDDCKQL